MDVQDRTKVEVKKMNKLSYKVFFYSFLLNFEVFNLNQ